jgi:serine peptidase DegS
LARPFALLAFAARAIVAGLAVAFVAILLRPELLAPPAAAPQQSGWADAVALAAPAIVSIYTVAPAGLAWRGSPGLGSGVIISAEGHVATNWHVIEGAVDIRVRLADGREAVPRLIGADPDTELALLQIDLPELPVIPLGRSARLRPGEVALAIGNPLGLSQTVTQGIVSAVGRAALGVATFEDFIQTDAAINLCNSGGALLDGAGRLIGINTAVIGAGAPGEGAPEGIGFAIPVDLVEAVAAQLLRHGRVIRGWLGVEPVDIGRERAARLGLPAGTRGIELLGVAPDSPAALAGLRPGDLLLGMDGEPFDDSRQALNRVAALAPGARVRLEVMRSDERFLLEAVLGERPAAPGPGRQP